jgi:nucleoside-diphosphate-sugar epimerase
MKIFVTGGSGFVGSATLDYLHKSGYRVAGMSRNPAHDNAIQLLGATPVRCDLETISENHLLGYDVVIHTAAFLGEWGNYEAFYAVNVLGTERLLRACKAAGVKKMIHISTEAVLFAGQDLIDIDETYPYPKTPYFYSATKQLAEKAVLKANEIGGLETICLRPRMVWGPGDKTILPLMMAAVKANKFLWIGGGHFKTSTTHIQNLVHAISLAIKSGECGKAYFITDGNDIDLRIFCTRLLATQGLQPSKKSIPKWMARTIAWAVEKVWTVLRLKHRPPITRFGAAIFSSHCTLKTELAKSQLCYQPIISIDEGIAELKTI